MVLIDIVILVMMTITVGFCWKLNNKIIQLQKGKLELAKLFKYFDNSLERAEGEITQIRDQASKITLTLNKKIELTKELIDSLANLQNKAKVIYKSLEDNISAGKQLQNELKADLEQASAQAQARPKRTEPKIYKSTPSTVSREPETASDNRVPYIPPTLKSNTIRESDKQRLAIENLLKKISEVNNADS